MELISWNNWEEKNNNVNQHIQRYQDIIKSAVEDFVRANPTSALYAPINYMMALKAKRWRPMLLLATAEGYGAKSNEAIDAALAVEVFHNFTLMHDDIMDNAPLRRGQPTVHETWSVNASILSGDAMMVQAFQLLEKSHPTHLPYLLKVFNKTAIEVCEGQQLDMDFEQRTDVTLDEYREMIRLKTSVLLAAAMKMGAICGNADAFQQELAYSFGEHFGLAFQLRDDYLDVFGDPGEFGKQDAGDILADKKTFLYLSALNAQNGAYRDELLKWQGPQNSQQKIEAVRNIFRASSADEATLEEMASHVVSARQALNQMEIGSEIQAFFHQLLEVVQTRTV